MAGRTSFMDNDKMDKYIDALIDTLLKVNPKLKAQVAQTPELRMNIKQVLQAKLDPQDKGLPENILRSDKNTPLIMQYAMMAMTAIGLVKEKDLLADVKDMLKPLLEDKEFMKDLQKIIDKKLTPKDIVKEVEKLMQDKFGEKFVSDIKLKMDKILNKVNDYLKETGLPPLQVDNSFVNLTGMLCNQPGAYFVPQTSFMGNGLAIVDANPNSGIANIDRVNSVEEGPFGDPLGLVASTQSEFSKNEATVTGEFSQKLYDQGFKSNLTLSQ